MDLLNLDPQYVIHYLIHIFFLYPLVSIWYHHVQYFVFLSWINITLFVIVLKNTRSDVEVMVDNIVAREPLVSENRKPQLRRLIYKLIEKLETNEVKEKIMSNHQVYDKPLVVFFWFLRQYFSSSPICQIVVFCLTYKSLSFFSLFFLLLLFAE